jgi:hypothetical protein
MAQLPVRFIAKSLVADRIFAESEHGGLIDCSGFTVPYEADQSLHQPVSDSQESLQVRRP